MGSVYILIENKINNWCDIIRKYKLLVVNISQTTHTPQNVIDNFIIG